MNTYANCYKGVRRAVLETPNLARARARALALANAYVHAPLPRLARVVLARVACALMGMGTSDEVELSAFISHCLALVEGAASLIRQAYDSADVAVQVSPRD
jgi:hypothetical protein